MSELSRYGIFLDELEKIRILHPEIRENTDNLKEQSKIYIKELEEFQESVAKFVHLFEKLSKEVENEKIEAIGARNVLLSMEKERENHFQEVQAVIAAKTLELERLNIQLNSLTKTEMEQTNLMHQLTQY